MARNRVEPDHFQNLSERLRLAARKLDELDAVHAQRIGRAGDQLTVGGLSHDAFLMADSAADGRRATLPDWRDAVSTGKSRFG
jgi:hypothetical protein